MTLLINLFLIIYSDMFRLLQVIFRLDIKECSYTHTRISCNTVKWARSRLH